MAKPWDITGDDLERWSRQYDAPAVLPDLIRRLLLATAPLSSISMAAHAGTRLPGWDGVVRADRETKFCPDGLSVWELTVQDDTGKFDKDFTKRAADPSPVVPRGTTYVAVSARSFKNRNRWAADQRAKGIWRDVRVIDGNDLAAWLSRAPAVARWFAGLLRRPAGDIDDLESFLDGWRRRTRPPLPIEIALAGEERRRLAESVRGWARTAGRASRALRIHAHTTDEALVFAAAALATDASPEGEQVRARTLIVRSEEALRWALASEADEPLIVLPLLDRQATPTRTDGPMILPLEGPLPSGGSDLLRLPAAPYARFAEILIRAGIPEQEARRQAEGSGGDLMSLQRLFGYVALPRWAQGLDAVALSAMLLVGEFQPDNQEDRDVLHLLGADAREVELLCERLRLGPDAPTHKEQGRTYRSVWSWRAPDAAWQALVGQIPADSLRRFSEVIQIVLGERDPSLDLAMEERVAAELHGKVLRASGSLREGLARSLVRLALNDEALGMLHGTQRGSTIAVVAVRQLLTPGWETWASLSALLPWLAEAAPDMFLDCVEASLRKGDKGVAHLLAEEAFMGASPHTGLLWALETLGWEENRMPRVASALARLAQFDAKLEKPGRLANRPKRSLEGLLQLTLVQTLASVDVRIGEMRRRLVETPDIGFELIVKLLGSLGEMNVVAKARVPVIRTSNIPDREAHEKRTIREIGRVARAYLDLMLEHADHEASAWAKVLEHFWMNAELAVPILERLERDYAQIKDDAALLWGGIRRVLHWSKVDEEENGAEEAAAATELLRGRWQSLYVALTPKEPALKFAWLFGSRVEMPEPPPDDYEDEEATLSTRRADALVEISSRPDKLQQIEALASMVEDKRSFSHYLATAPFAPELDVVLIDHVPSPVLMKLLPGYVASRQRTMGPSWFKTALLALLEQGRTDDVTNVFQGLEATASVWDVIDVLPADVQRKYWLGVSRIHGASNRGDLERAIQALLQAGNVACAVRVAGRAKESASSETIALVLEAFVKNPSEIQRFRSDPVAAHMLKRLLDRMDGVPGVDGTHGLLLAKIEQIHSLMPHAENRSMPHLSAVFAANADQYVDLVRHMGRPEGEPLPSASQAEQDSNRELAETAYTVLEAWTGFPGEGLPAETRDDVLYEWTLKSLRTLVGEGRARTGASELARVLARAPAGEDKHWPCVAARRLLESDEFPSLSRGLQIAKRTMRGMTGRALDEGGKQERAIATTHREVAKLMRLVWPRTADMLEGLAQDYESDALREDAEAQSTLREHGAEPGDFGSRPAAPAPSPNRRIVSPGIVRLDSIEIHDFTRFDHLALDTKRASPDLPLDRGQWLILLGDNGRGKSSILRALVLALAGTNVAQAVVGQYAAPLIRNEQSSARCDVQSGALRFSATITNEGTGQIAACEPANGPRPLVFAYGCRRGSALGGNDSADLNGSATDVITLFNESVRLHPAPSWLQRLKLRALQHPKHDEIFNTVTKMLCSLLPDVDRMDVVDDQVWAIAPKLGGRLPLSALSDGYLTTLGWLVDLIARWLHWAEQTSQDLTGNFFERMEGLVLLDEIDLHLHPVWQREIIGKLKNAFPRLSFVVTTHNPLTLLGAEAGEIMVLRASADGSGRTEGVQIDLPPGIRADRVLTGEWFGLPTTVDDETADLSSRHQRMLLAKVPASDPERIDVEEKLRARLGTFGDISLDRMALEVAADLMRELQPSTPEEREKMRLTLKDRVRARRAEELARGGVKS
jgi:hypothetical protein